MKFQRMTFAEANKIHGGPWLCFRSMVDSSRISYFTKGQFGKIVQEVPSQISYFCDPGRVRYGTDDADSVEFNRLREATAADIGSPVLAIYDEDTEVEATLIGFVPGRPRDNKRVVVHNEQRGVMVVQTAFVMVSQ